jgi:hypothetical protein
MILEISWDSLWMLAFDLSQFHRHGSWPMCELALTLNIEPHEQAYLLAKTI